MESNNDMKKYLLLLEGVGETKSGCSFVIDDVSFSSDSKNAYVSVTFDDCKNLEDSMFNINGGEYQLDTMSVDFTFSLSEEEIELPAVTSRAMSPRYKSIRVINKLDDLEISEVYFTSTTDDKEDISDVRSVDKKIVVSLSNQIESDDDLIGKIITEAEKRI